MKSTAVALLCAFVSVVAFAQTTTGNLEGWVHDVNRSPVYGANITVTSPDLQGVRGISTDERGYFRLLALPGGVYTVKLHHVSYQPATFEKVQISLGRTTMLPDVKLQLRSVDVGEVVISGERRLLDPSSAASRVDLPLEEVEILPLERNHRSVATLVPGADQSYYGDEINVAGGTGAENRYFIDGHDVTNWYNGVGGTNLPYNFVREVEVKTGGYEAEYRSSLGGAVNVVTYSGGNDFSGQAFGFVTNTDFSGEPQLAANEPPSGRFSQYDFGVAVGGPIVRDKLWFFGALDPSYRNEDKRVPALGYYPAHSQAVTFAAKLSWRVSENLDITATVVGDPTTEESVGGPWFWSHYAPSSALNPDPFLVDVTRGGYSGQIDVRNVATQSLILQGSLSWITWRQRYLPSTERGSEAYFYDRTTGTASGGTGEHLDVTTSIPDVKFSGTALLGDHTVKAGIEYQRPLVDNVNTFFRITKNSDTDYRMAHFDLSGKAWNHSLSAFVQDSWTVGRSWRILAGLRWDGEFVIASNGELMMRILRQFQPRLGIVFMPSGDESQKLFASVGRYQEDFMAYASTMYYIDGAYQTIVRFNHDPRLDPSGGDTTTNSVAVLPASPENLYGQYYDEIALGYEQLLARDLKITVKGTYRTIRQGIDDAEAPPGTEEFHIANPGEGVLSAYPHPKREYSALEISMGKSWGGAFNILASYVLSRNYGNWLGLYIQRAGTGAFPNASSQFDYLDLLEKNADGLLPNDRTHVFKLNAAYRFDFGLTCGTSFSWQTGTPLSEYAGTRGGGGNWTWNVVPRGSAGRMPSLWDLNLRLAYSPSFWSDVQLQPRLIVDVLHLGSQRRPVVQEELHYLDTDENGYPVDPNATYGLPTRFQPPMSVRLGLEVNF